MNKLRTLAVVVFLLSPMAANADLITYVSNAFDGPSPGSYIIVEADVTATSEGLYDEAGGGLLGWTISVYDTFDALVLMLAEANACCGDNNFVHILSDGTVDEWYFYADNRSTTSRPTRTAYTINTTGQYVSDCLVSPNCSSFTGDHWYGPNQPWLGLRDPGRWATTEVPEPGALALLGLGLVGMAARRRKKV